MSGTATLARQAVAAPRRWIWFARILVILAIVPALLGHVLPAALQRPPDWAILPIADWINAGFGFLATDLGLMRVSRAFAAGVGWLIDVAANLLYGKNRWPGIGPIPWTVVALCAFFVGYALKGWRLGLLSGGTFVWIALLGQWKWAMETLSVLVVAAPFAISFGLILGVAAWRFPKLEKALHPILNIAQSLPHFAYMIPVVVFIGVGPKAGAIVTFIFASPPMVRMTLLGLQRVNPSVIDSGRMSGANGWQLLRKVLIPTSRTEVLVGINQVIMQSLAMVVLASFIGMPGLGQKLLQLLQALKIGRAIELGISITLLAIALDRCSKAWVVKVQHHADLEMPWWQRYRILLIGLGASGAGFALASQWQLAELIPRSRGITVSQELDAGVELLLSALDPTAIALKSFLIVNILTPWRDAYLWMPTSSVILLFAALGLRFGGGRSALICAGYWTFIALSGWWDRAMITAYMVSFSVGIAAIIGLPVGILAARHMRASRLLLLICDTAQTFPSFIYLIPVIMLFGVNDVAAIGAVIAFGTIPIVRYTIEALKSVPATLIDAASMSGANRRQTLWQVKVPFSAPTIAVGFNQAVLFSLFMVIIAAFIGTQDLGQELQRALSFTDVGKGLVLGLCVAFMGMSVDHLIMDWSRRRRHILGMT